MVYLLPGMDEPIDPRSRDRFLQLYSDVTLVMWLRMIEERNRQYQAMQNTGILLKRTLKVRKMPTVALCAGAWAYPFAFPSCHPSAV